MTRAVRFLCLPALLVLVACKGGGSNPSPPAGGQTKDVDQTLPDRLVRQPTPTGTGCGPGSFRLVQQRLRASAAYALGATGGPGAPHLPAGVWEVHTSVSDARYTTRQQPVGPDCADVGPFSPVLVIRLAYAHESWADRSPNPVCIWRSKIVLTRYEVDDLPPGMGELIRQQVQEDAHRATDRAVASGLTELFWGVPMDPGAEARCGDWASL